jgi:SAM-dependent methyltransferase
MASPATWDYDAVRQYLLDMEAPPGEQDNHRSWIEWHLPRFLRTLSLVPEGAQGQRCLEIGSIPYTFTVLMQKFRPYEMTLVDFDSSGRREQHRTVRLPRFGEVHDFVSHMCDVEREDLPFADCTFDGVLCCEVLEHLTTDPIMMLAGIHRVLKPDGWLILTTPNVATITNILALLHGRNIYSPYELACGPTWRHNREYTATEVSELLVSTGFTIEHLSIEEARPTHQRLPLSQRIIKRLLGSWYRQEYGNQLYIRTRRGPVFRSYYPAWLFQHIEFCPRARATQTT